MQFRIKLLLPALFLFSAVSTTIFSQEILNLDSCRSLALRNNKTLAQSRANFDKASWESKAARTNYYPKVTAMASYMRTGDELSLLNNSQKSALSSLGTGFSKQFAEIATPIVTQFPDLAPLITPIGQGMENSLNGIGNKLKDALRTDTRNLSMGAVILTQPLYMGGKIIAYDKITRYSEQIADEQVRSDEQEVVMEVDKAYWQVVSLSNKRKLAVSYLEMLKHLESDVTKLIEQGVATKANLLSVSVKVNEAEMTLTKVDDGLVLSRMLLCQLCGLPLDSKVSLPEEKSENLVVNPVEANPDVTTAFSHRPELNQLQTAMSIYDEKVKIERSAFLPQLALTGGYMISNPSVFNGFENKFKGTWGVGVTLKVPVWNWGEGRYKVKAAKAEAMVAKYKLDDAKDKIALQVSQSAFNSNEALKKLSMANKNMEKADENMRIAKAGFKEGVVTTSDVLEAQTAWLQAHSDKIDAQVDTKLCKSALEKALGTLGKL